MERLFLEFVIRAALLVAATAVVLFLMRIRAAAARHRVWTAVVVAVLLPVWTVWEPKVPLRLLPALPETTADAATLLALPTAHRSFPSPSISAPQAVLLSIYFLGLGLLLSRLAIGTFAHAS
jgi:hypothetical protein